MKKIDVIYREASKLFAQRGYEGVSMREVADTCGITLATLYYHFSSKDDLHDEITQFRFEEFLAQLETRPGMDPKAGQIGRPSSVLAGIFDAVCADPTLFNLMQHDLLYFDSDRRKSHCRERKHAFMAVISKSLARHWGFDPDERSVFSLAALITGYCELVQADERFEGIDRQSFLSERRAALVSLVAEAFDRPRT